MSIDTESINSNKYTSYFDKILDEEVRLLKSIISFLESDLLKEITNVTPIQERTNLFNKLLRACAKKDNSLANIISAINNNLPIDSEQLKEDTEDSSDNFEETMTYISKFSKDLGFPTDFLKNSFIGELFSNFQDTDTENVTKDFIDIENLNIYEDNTLKNDCPIEETILNEEATRQDSCEINNTNSIEDLQEPPSIIASNEYVEPFEAKETNISSPNYDNENHEEDTASNYYNNNYYNYGNSEDSKESYDYYKPYSESEENYEYTTSYNEINSSSSDDFWNYTNCNTYSSDYNSQEEYENLEDSPKNNYYEKDDDSSISYLQNNLDHNKYTSLEEFEDNISSDDNIYNCNIIIDDGHTINNYYNGGHIPVDSFNITDFDSYDDMAIKDIYYSSNKESKTMQENTSYDIEEVEEEIVSKDITSTDSIIDSKEENAVQNNSTETDSPKKDWNYRDFLKQFGCDLSHFEVATKVYDSKEELDMNRDNTTLEISVDKNTSDYDFFKDLDFGFDSPKKQNKSKKAPGLSYYFSDIIENENKSSHYDDDSNSYYTKPDYDNGCHSNCSHNKPHHCNPCEEKCKKACNEALTKCVQKNPNVEWDCKCTCEKDKKHCYDDLLDDYECIKPDNNNCTCTCSYKPPVIPSTPTTPAKKVCCCNNSSVDESILFIIAIFFLATGFGSCGFGGIGYPGYF